MFGIMGVGIQMNRDAFKGKVLDYFISQNINLNEIPTIANQGFQKVKANIMWEARVPTTAHITHVMFLPTLSTRIPKIGDIGADMTYTMLK